MKILAFDTSTEWCSVALDLDGTLSSRAVLAGQRHSEWLLPMVQELLAEAGLVLTQLDALAIGQGPGSFTGLRIACGAAQGLAFGANLPVVPVITLEAMAAQALADSEFDGAVVCVDARMNEVYAAVYAKAPAGLAAQVAPGLFAPSAAPLPVAAGRYLGCGSGFAAYAEPLATRYGDRLAELRPERYPHAEWIARLAADKWRAGQAVVAEAVEPLYIRDKVALKTCERA
ncbi:tRNA threonylcarbamoyladenosine biosynthesis protein TsaB [Sulfuritortus calidifontis]|uniref:tRNA threonylcarbamoyladenosine biosynthesis protein TsaB n=1 Tax=Sulfuritortus calidifontis TaxID=1914471 RepID=A0A4R3JWC8_9PROT|nr:tRNA (adenosine(37)-N6)-threonylcarbamoyltransferase complex dimerization subunit type 1 TsaB [Sulfuritortus calidifontis]TCS70561.1 tRNA threonylcarbamoyladenosine biosynthesis protein TsaB [Sulfuritortus calidifontis]